MSLTPPPASPRATPPEIALGPALPVLHELPTLEAEAALGSQPRHSRLAAGTHFEGQVRFAGALTLAGSLSGRIEAAAEARDAHLSIAEGGRLVGEAVARSISVQGWAEGLLAAPGGRVVLHASAVVSGTVRYGQLQVNGADLNARVERAAAAEPALR